MTNWGCILPTVFCLALAAVRAPGQPRAGGSPDGTGWREALTRVHARFTGRPGTFAQFGDSITVTMAYWAPLPDGRKNEPPEMERAYRVVEGRMRRECWREWKGAEYGSDGGRTIRWAGENVDAWLRKLNP